MKHTSLFTLGAVAVVMLAACSLKPMTNPLVSNSIIIGSGYDANSWKTMIPETCQAFHDGCNECSRMGSGDDAACTKMFCEEYSEPYCKDDLPSTPSISGQAEVEKMYVGLTLDQAKLMASQHNTPFRITMLDGEAQIVTMDYRAGRINATVSSGVVTDIDVE